MIYASYLYASITLGCSQLRKSAAWNTGLEFWNFKWTDKIGGTFSERFLV